MKKFRILLLHGMFRVVQVVMTGGGETQSSLHISQQAEFDSRENESAGVFQRLRFALRRR